MNKKIYLLIMLILLSGCSKPSEIQAVETVPDFPTVNYSIMIAMDSLPTEIAVTQDGSRIYLLDFYERLYELHLETGTKISVTQMQKKLPDDAYVKTETKDFIFKPDPSTDELEIVRKADQETRRVATGRNPQLCTLTPDGTKLLVTNHADQTIQVYAVS
jgi:DNA-binding beta-propeller fold protein YncE